MASSRGGGPRFSSSGSIFSSVQPPSSSLPALGAPMLFPKGDRCLSLTWPRACASQVTSGMARCGCEAGTGWQLQPAPPFSTQHCQAQQTTLAQSHHSAQMHTVNLGSQKQRHAYIYTEVHEIQEHLYAQSRTQECRDTHR